MRRRWIVQRVSSQVAVRGPSPSLWNYADSGHCLIETFFFRLPSLSTKVIYLRSVTHFFEPLAMYLWRPLYLVIPTGKINVRIYFRDSSAVFYLIRYQLIPLQLHKPIIVFFDDCRYLELVKTFSSKRNRLRCSSKMFPHKKKTLLNFT